MKPLRPDDPRELGPYRLLRRIGEGGMGVVFLAVAVDGADGDDLAAVKAVRSEYAGDREFHARFNSEVELARRVRGPYTARVLAADTDGPHPWLATEYISGPALHEAVRESGPFPEDSLRALAAGLAEALAAIHSVGLVHRDLKPANVLLSPRGPQVIDFGIARAADATALTRTGQTLGTPAYMSPEQATGAHLGPRSDLFAFGGVLLFAATGRRPFGTGGAPALLYRVVNEEPDLDGVPDSLLPLVTACLAKDPGDRPELGAVLAELAGTALPRGDDDPTEWLPEAVATRVLDTVAATRTLPTRAHAEEGTGEEPEPRTPEAAEEPAQDGEPIGPGTGDPEGSRGAESPREDEESRRGEGSPGAEEIRGSEESPAESSTAAKPTGARGGEGGERSELPAWARRTGGRGGPGRPDGTEEAGGRRSPEGTAKPSAGPPEPERPGAGGRPRDPRGTDGPQAAERSAPSAPAGRGAPAPARNAPWAVPDAHRVVKRAPEPRRSSAGAAWGAAISVLSLLVALVVVLNLGDAEDAPGTTGADGRGTEEESPAPARDPGTSTAPEPAEPAEIQEVAFLDGERFAVLSSVGVHLYETDGSGPTEQLVDADSRSLGRSKLVTDRNGTALAVQDGGHSSGSESTVVVWDLEEDEEHHVRLPEAFRSGAPLALSPDAETLFVGTGLVSGPGRHRVTAYETRTGEQLYSREIPEDGEGLQGSVQDLGTSPDGELLIAALTSGLAVWNAATGEPVPGVPELREWSGSLSGPMAVTDDVVATASYEHLLLWDPWSQAGPESFEVTFDNSGGHPELDPEVNPWITSLSVADDGDTIVAAGHVSRFHGFLRRWDRNGETLDEQWTDTVRYRAAQTPPSGGGVLVAAHPLTGGGPDSLTLLDGDLEAATEFALPTDQS
ncbi:protein kinase domain-containing protein [Nocardiopsis terrae]